MLSTRLLFRNGVYKQCLKKTLEPLAFTNSVVVRFKSNENDEDPLARIKFKHLLSESYEERNKEPKKNSPTLLSLLEKRKQGVNKRKDSVHDLLNGLAVSQDRGMPVDEMHLAPLRQRRKFKRFKRSSFIPNTVEFVVLGNGSPGGARSLYLYTDNERFLFNCSEGVQRIAMEYCKSKSLAHLGHIFVTNRSWQNMGGLGGMMLSVRSAGAPDIRLHGPGGIKEFYEALRSFAVLSDFDVFYQNEPDLDDCGIAINQIMMKPKEGSAPILPPNPKYSRFEESHSPPMTSAGDEINYNTLPKNLYKPRVPEPYDRTIASYIVTCKAKAGRLMIDKCKELGVPPGPLLGELKAGRDVILDDGTCVKSADVMEEPLDPLKYIVIEIPDEDYLEALLNEDRLNAQKGEDMNWLQTIFHFTPYHIMKSEPYMKWMNSFSPRVQHVLINDKNIGHGSLDLLGYSQRLNYINPKIFSELDPDTKSRPAECDLKVNGPVISPVIGQRFHVRPHTGVMENPFSDRQDYKEEIESNFEAMKLIKVLKEKEVVKDVPEYPVVTFLGTGSSTPSKYRCASSILIETEPDNFIMLDCGEGTMLQMNTLYGHERSQEIMRNLKGIYISHLHADHHLGFINLVQNRQKAFEAIGSPVEKLYLMSPHRMSKYLNVYHWKIEPILQDLVQVKNEYLVLNVKAKDACTRAIWPNDLSALCNGCGFQDINVECADHCPGSFLVLLTLKSGYKILYTGDTRPSEGLVNLGCEFGPVDLLLHEATMEHKMLADAIKKKHSTTIEAIDVGKKIKAGFTLLTHFSQRYSKVPMLDEIEGHPRVGAAWDYMRVNPQTFHLISESFPALKVVFEKNILEITEKRENLRKSEVAKILAEEEDKGVEDVINENGKRRADVE